MREEQRILEEKDLHTHTAQETMQRTETTGIIQRLTDEQETGMVKLQELIRQ